MEKEEKKEKEFFTLLSDTTLKKMFKDEDSRFFFEKVIKYYSKLDLEGYELYDNEINSGNVARDYRLDVLLKKDRDFIIVEMNKDVSERVLIKNRMYLFLIAGGGLEKGEDFVKMKTALINFNNSLYKIKPDAINIDYTLRNEKYNDVIDDIKIHNIYLESLKNVRYNGSNEEETFAAMMIASTYEEMREIANGNEEALYIVDKLERLNEDDKFRTDYNVELVRRKEINSARLDGFDDGYDAGKAEGKEEEKISIAKNLLEKEVSLEIVSESTGLSIEELENLTD